MAKVHHIDGRFKLEVSIGEIVDKCGALSDDDMRNAHAHVADVAMQNEDATGLELLLAVVQGDEERLPKEVIDSLRKIFVEMIAAGKELTLRKVMRVLDPHGEFIDIEEDDVLGGKRGDVK